MRVTSDDLKSIVFRKKKYIFYFILIFLLIAGWFNYDHIRYGVEQGKGQLEIIWNAKPLDEVLADPQFPDSLKSKLRLITEIRQFAIDSLGINDTENYSTLYDQQGKPTLWIVSASPDYEIRAYEWCFPIAGCFPYKGYFDHTKAVHEQKKLNDKGYDTDLRIVDGWSTLGIFSDPILSNMLNDDEGELAELIIHELTHATLYIKDSAEYNENLATFVGNYGALEFLDFRFGDTSLIYRNYQLKLADSRVFANYMVEQIGHLKVLYTTFTGRWSKTIKDHLKMEAIRKVQCSLDLTRFGNPQRYMWMQSPDRYPLNNAYFSQFLTYHEEANVFEQEFREQFNSNFRSYLEYLKKKFGT